MDGATVQDKIYAGYGQAATRIGETASIYRPTNALSPIGTAIGTILAAFDQRGRFENPNKYGQNIWYGLFDGCETQVGDYLICDAGTFFIAAQQHILPILCVSCNRTVSVYELSGSADVGAQSYNDAKALTAIMTGWPCSILQGTKGETNPVHLPDDVKMPWWSILLPLFTGVTIQTTDIIIDDLGRRYAVSSPELTDLGWRISAGLVGA